jgi:hypothetical protein
MSLNGFLHGLYKGFRGVRRLCAVAPPVRWRGARFSLSVGRSELFFFFVKPEGAQNAHVRTNWNFVTDRPFYKNGRTKSLSDCGTGRSVIKLWSDKVNNWLFHFSHERTYREPRRYMWLVEFKSFLWLGFRVKVVEFRDWCLRFRV